MVCKSRTLVGTIALLSCLSVGRTERGTILNFTNLFQSSRSAYDKLNAYLESRKYIGPEDDMNVSLDWLEAQVKSGMSKNPMDLLRGLNGIQHGNQCDKEGYKIVLRNNKATNGNALNFNLNEKQLRRVDKMVRYYLEQHAKVCQIVHAESIELKINEMDGEKVKNLEQVTIGYIEGRIRGNNMYRSHRYTKPILYWEKPDLMENWENNNEEYKNFVRAAYFNSFESFPQNSNMFEYAIRNDPDSGKVIEELVADSVGKKNNVDEVKVKTLFNTYLIEPCKYYIRELRDIFELIENDEKVIGTCYFKNKLSTDYLVHKATFQMCDVLVNKAMKKFLKDLLEELRSKRY